MTGAGINTLPLRMLDEGVRGKGLCPESDEVRFLSVRLDSTGRAGRGLSKVMSIGSPTVAGTAGPCSITGV